MPTGSRRGDSQSQTVTVSQMQQLHLQTLGHRKLCGHCDAHQSLRCNITSTLKPDARVLMNSGHMQWTNVMNVTRSGKPDLASYARKCPAGTFLNHGKWNPGNSVGPSNTRTLINTTSRNSKQHPAPSTNNWQLSKFNSAHQTRCCSPKCKFSCT